MYILGISCFYHDAAAALLQDGKLIAAAEEERFTRIKHDFDFPKNAIQFCLDYAGITGKDLDYVVFYEKPFQKFERILMTSFQGFPKSWKAFKEAMITWLGDKLWVKSIIKEKVGVEDNKILFGDHHLSHAASGFYPSPFEKAAILTVDGVGEWTTATMGIGRGTEIKLLKEIKFPHSLGLLYSAFTAFLGFKVNEGEYKVMGMAPYGKPRYIDKIYDNLVNVAPDGSFWLNMDYFSYHRSDEKTFNSKFEGLFGKPRPPEMHFFTSTTRFPSYFGEKPVNFDELCRKNEYYADVAASIQKVTEEILLKLANSLYKETGLSKLCIAGGVGLNSVANGRILRETGVSDCLRLRGCRRQQYADPAIKMACGRRPETAPALASQPTISRLENMVSRTDLYRIAQVLLEAFLDSYETPPEGIIIDMDDETHSGQQLSLFNAFYDSYCYEPIHIYEGRSVRLMTTVLRPGKPPSGKEVVAILKRVVKRIRDRWPGTGILLRADSHYSSPAVMEFCERENLKYILGLTPQKPMCEGTRPLMEEAAHQQAILGRPVRLFGEFTYRAKPG